MGIGRGNKESIEHSCFRDLELTRVKSKKPEGNF